jgi:hypothetical protein
MTVSQFGDERRLYRELAVRSLRSLRPVEPLAEVPPDRPRLPIERSESTPLHLYRTKKET